jgi:predicted AAA+ superfamily ATPase
MQRVQKQYIIKDLNKKIVLITGPRQAGKTWLAKDIAKDFSNSLYLNYDQFKDQEIIKNQSWLKNIDLLILDELHKMPNWKNYLKGLYDTKSPNTKIIVTGSARLDIFAKFGDSLAGRFFCHHLLPISLAELTQVGLPQDLDKLIEFGGFPEAYLNSNLIESQRWRQQYINSLLSTDVFEFDRVQNIKALHLIFDLLRHRVGSQISYRSIAEDVGISPITVKKYIEILEALFIIFRIFPHSKNIARSLLKEPKIYFFDNGLVEGDKGAKLENLVAGALLKHAYGKSDYLAQDLRLHYIKTKDGREVDFALSNKNEISTLFEVKYADNQIAKPLQYFANKYNLAAIQLVKEINHEYQDGNIKVLNASNFLAQLFL